MEGVVDRVLHHLRAAADAHRARVDHRKAGPCLVCARNADRLAECADIARVHPGVGDDCHAVEARAGLADDLAEVPCPLQRERGERRGVGRCHEDREGVGRLRLLSSLGVPDGHVVSTRELEVGPHVELMVVEASPLPVAVVEDRARQGWQRIERAREQRGRDRVDAVDRDLVARERIAEPAGGIGRIGPGRERIVELLRIGAQ
jgi:hypothetical protein